MSMSHLPRLNAMRCLVLEALSSVGHIDHHDVREFAQSIEDDALAVGRDVERVGGRITRQPCELTGVLRGNVKQPERLLADWPEQVHDRVAAREKSARSRRPAR